MAGADRDGRFESGLSVPAELRTELGLGPDESVRVLDVGVRTILLERTEAVETAALPWDLDLVLVADVRAFPLADVLGLLHGAGKSGFLYFTHDDLAKSVYLNRGEVVFAGSNQRVDRLGECLLRAGVLTLEQLREAERRFTPPDRFGKALVERGFLSPRELWSGVKYQVEEIVRSLFSHTAGKVLFWEGEVQPDNVVRLSLPTRRLVAEGVQRRDELMRFLALLQDPGARLEPVLGQESGLSKTERRIFDGLRGDPSFASLCRREQIDALSAARMVQLLRLVGAVRVRRAHSESYLGEADLRSHDEASLRDFVTDHLKLLGELAAPIVAVDGSDRVRERVERVVEDLGTRHPDLMQGLRVGAGGTLDPEEFVGRVLKLTEDREAKVRAVLGELVAYLEFELKNHPRIEDAERFLEAVEPLRAKLNL